MPLIGDRKREYDRIWMAKRRSDWLSDKSCVWCGSTENLEVDHKDPATKQLRIASLWGMSPGNPRRVAELQKCQVLCSHHHDVKSALELSLLGVSTTRPCRPTKYVS